MFFILGGRSDFLCRSDWFRGGYILSVGLMILNFEIFVYIFGMGKVFFFKGRYKFRVILVI